DSLWAHMFNHRPITLSGMSGDISAFTDFVAQQHRSFGHTADAGGGRMPLRPEAGGRYQIEHRFERAIELGSINNLGHVFLSFASVTIMAAEIGSLKTQGCKIVVRRGVHGRSGGFNIGHKIPDP